MLSKSDRLKLKDIINYYDNIKPDYKEEYINDLHSIYNSCSTYNTLSDVIKHNPDKVKTFIDKHYTTKIRTMKIKNILA
jgi:3-methyladenine DNA glycosylase AlkC